MKKDMKKIFDCFNNYGELKPGITCPFYSKFSTVCENCRVGDGKTVNVEFSCARTRYFLVTHGKKLSSLSNKEVRR